MNKKKQLANKKHRKNQARIKRLLHMSLKLAKPKKSVPKIKVDKEEIKEIIEVKETQSTKKPATKKAPEKKSGKKVSTKKPATKKAK